MKLHLWSVAIITWLIASVLVLYAHDAFEIKEPEKPLIILSDVVSYREGYSKTVREYHIASEYAAGMTGQILYSKILALNKISSVRPQNYLVHVDIGECFVSKWDEVNTDILETIESHIVEMEKAREDLDTKKESI